MNDKSKITNLLIVVDMVNGFLKKGNMADPSMMHIVDEQIKLIEKFIKEKQEVVFFAENHNEESVEFLRYPKHCISGDWEAEVIDELKKYQNDSNTYFKNSTCGIFAKGFVDDILKMEKLERIIMVGCCTDICLMNLAIPLKNLFDEMDKDIQIVVPKNAVDTYDSPSHRRDEYNEMAFKFLNQAGIEIAEEIKEM